MRIFIIVLLSIISCCTIYAQQPPISPAQAQAELKKRGITEAELQAKLDEKGINLNDINPTNPREVAEVQKAIEEAIEEIEKEKEANQTSAAEESSTLEETVGDVKETIENKIEEEIDEATQQSVDEISTAVEEGKSIEEAIAEEASELIQEKLPNSNIYGQHLFRNKSLKIYTKSEDALPPNSYLLGVGDEVNISIWGISQEDFNLEVEKDGYIYPSGIARVYLKGLTLEKAKSAVRSRLSGYYSFREDQFEMNLKFVRTLNVNIWGEAINIGSFNIPATNSAFNALVAAGGPSKIGSVRNIQLIRSSGNKRVDIYNFIDDPSVQNDLYLQNNDVIYIPIAERLIEIEGAVNRPMIYELIKGEELFQLIEYAGGLTASAYTKIIQIERIQNNERIIIDVNFQDLINSQNDFELLNGDKVSIKSIPRPFQNFVEISGAVEYPGRFALEPGMKIIDLIEKGKLLDEARKDFAFLLRTNDDQTANWIRLNVEDIQNNPNSLKNITLRSKDKIQIYTLERYANKALISVSGAVRVSGEFPYDQSGEIRVEDLVLLGGGLEQNATEIAYVKRVDPTNKTNHDFIKINVFSALNNPLDTINNIIIEPFDQLVVYSKESFSENYSVSTEGFVRSPGTFAYDEDLKVSDLIYLSSGLNVEATGFGYIKRTEPSNPYTTQYIRVDDLEEIINNPNSVKNISVRPGDVLEIFSNQRYTDNATISISGAVRLPGDYQFNPTLSLKDVLTMSGGLKLEASPSKIEIFRVVIQKDQPTKTIVATLSVNENYDIVGGGNLGLQPYDKIVVRTVPNFEFQQMVQINGEIFYPGSYALTSKNEKLLDLLNRTGGLTTEAFPEGATIQRSEDNIGPVVTRLDKVLGNPNSKFNYVLKEGDIITIPKSKDLVTINLESTLAKELYPDRIAAGERVSVAYEKTKRAKWYINKYAAGIDRNQRARKRFIGVEYPNGQIKRGNFFFSPKIRSGSIISTGKKPKEIKEEVTKPPKEPIDWTRTITDTVAIVSSVLTILVLANRL